MLIGIRYTSEFPIASSVNKCILYATAEMSPALKSSGLAVLSAVHKAISPGVGGHSWQTHWATLEVFSAGVISLQVAPSVKVPLHTRLTCARGSALGHGLYTAVPISVSGHE